MAIEVTQIIGDTVELVFNPAEEALHVGENLSVLGRQENRGLIVQVIEIRAMYSASWLVGRDQRPSVGPPGAAPVGTPPRTRSPRRRKTPQPAPGLHNLSVAIAKIRKMTDPAWQPWDGWVPTNTVVVTKTTDDEVLRQCVPDFGTPLWLGKTVSGEPFHIERDALGTLNLIAGGEESGTVYLAQVLIRQLMEHSHPCIVFDTKGVYDQLSEESGRSSTRERVGHAIVRLTVGENLKLAMAHMSLDTLSTILRQFGLPTVVALYFTSHVARRFARLKSQQDADQPPPFLGIDELIHLALDLEAEGQPVAAGAILSCLDAIKHAQIFATQPSEETTLHDGFVEIRYGGALVIDLSRLTRCALTSVVSFLVGSLRDLSVGGRSPESDRGACLFFDEAQSLLRRDFITDVLRPVQPLGLTSFFVTTQVIGRGEHLQHDVDNLFLCQVTSADARRLAKHSRVDAATLENVARRLRTHHNLLVGKATREYPIIFATEPIDGLEVTGDSAAWAYMPGAPRMHPATRARARFAVRAPAPASSDPSLPLFPEGTPPLTATHKPRDDEQRTKRPDLSPPTLEQVLAMWDQVVKRVARRRRILETILAAARPRRVNQQRLTLSFPPQQRFQQELVESDEYRSLLEEELKKVFGVSLEVTTEVYPT